MGRWINKPSEFQELKFGELGFTFPVITQEDHGDGTYTGIIAEDNLSTVKRILLSLYYN